MDYELELICAQNAERRRFAEETDRRIRLAAADAEMEEMQEKEMNKWRRWGRNVKTAGRVHLVVSAVLALLGLPMWAVMGLFGAAFFYLCAWEFRVLEGGHGK